MSWFIYEVPEYNEDGARIEPFSDLRSRVVKLSGQAMADELESVRENAATTADTPVDGGVKPRLNVDGRLSKSVSNKGAARAPSC